MFWRMLATIISVFLAVSLLAYVNAAEIKKDEKKRTQSGTDAVFVEEKKEQLGKHTYYPSTLFDVRYLDDDEKSFVRIFMEKADENLTYDVYVTGFNTAVGSGDFRMYGFRMEQGAVEPDVPLTTEISQYGTVSWGSSRYGMDAKLPDIFFDLYDVRPAEEFFQTVYDLAEEHKGAMFALREEEPIHGTYLLKVKHTGEVFYEFRINEFSYVHVNAVTGEITYRSFWNGVYED